MADKKANIKLTLTASAFKSGLKDAEKEVDKSAGNMKKALKGALTDGIKGAGDALRSTFSTIKSTVLSIGGIAGGIGIAELARGAVQGEAQFRRLAFAIKTGTGAIVDFRALQKQAQTVAIATGQSIEDLGDVMERVFAETGNADFARDTIQTIATAANGAHKPVAALGTIAGTLNEKFAIGKEEIGDALAQVVELGNKGGLSVEDMAEKLGLIGAAAKEAGMGGREGLGEVLSLMNLADNSTGSLKKGIAGVSGILETLGVKATRNKVAMQLGIDSSKLQGSAQQQIETILRATKGSKEKLELAFGGEQLKILADLGKTYADTFAQTSGDVKSKTTAATNAVHEAFSAAGKSTLKYSDLQAEAATEMQSSEKQMAVALEKLKAAFTKPEITDAINKLMSSLPALADIIASVVGFAAEHPVLAAGVGGVAVAGQGFIGAAGSSLASSAIQAAFARGGPAAATALTTGITAGAQTGAGTISAAISGASGGLGSAISSALLPLALFAAAAYAGGKLRDAYEEDKVFREKEKQRVMKEIDDAGGEVEQRDMFGNITGYQTNARDENGVWGIRNSKIATARRSLEGQFGHTYQGRAAEPDEFREGFYGDPTDSFREGFYGGGGGAKPASASGGMSAENARLLADMLGNKKLRVEVTNPEAIRGGPGMSGGSPTPGNMERP